MTFVEAAADILDREGRPLHAKEIAEKAVALGLLSHVGKTPVQTMSTQLSAAVLKGKGPFSRVRPGVFTLTKWEGKPPGPRPKPAVEKATVPPAPPAQKSLVPKAQIPSSPVPKPAAAPAGTTAVPNFPNSRSEGGPSVADDEAVDGGQKRRKRRRKKSAKGVSSAAPDPVAPQIAADRKGTAPPTPPTPPTSESRFSSNESRFSSSESRFSSSEPGSSRPSVSTGSESRRSAEPESPAGDSERFHSGDTERAPEEISDRVEKLLRRAPRPMPTQALLEQLGVSAQNGPVLLEALLASDGLEREKEGQRSRFVKHKSGWGLAAREVSGEILALENQAAEIRRRLAHLAERQLLKKLRVLPISAFVRIFMMYLERSGFGSVQPAGHSSIDGIHLSVQDRQRKGLFRTAVILRKESADHLLTEHAVMDLRGALHHFGAVGGMIFTTGRVTDKASEEGRVPNLPPISVMDGETLAREMVRMGIGVKERTVSLPAFDDGLFAKLES